MNVNTYDTVPLLDEIIANVVRPVQFVDNEGGSWFRVSGDRFLAADSEGLAIEAWFASKFDESVDIKTLRRENQNGRLV
jgi:hypothetical protein